MFFLCKKLAIVRAPIQEWLVIHEFNKWEGSLSSSEKRPWDIGATIQDLPLTIDPKIFFEAVKDVCSQDEGLHLMVCEQKLLGEPTLVYEPITLSYKFQESVNEKGEKVSTITVHDSKSDQRILTMRFTNKVNGKQDFEALGDHRWVDAQHGFRLIGEAFKTHAQNRSKDILSKAVEVGVILKCLDTLGGSSLIKGIGLAWAVSPYSPLALLGQVMPKRRDVVVSRDHELMTLGSRQNEFLQKPTPEQKEKLAEYKKFGEDQSGESDYAPTKCKQHSCDEAGDVDQHPYSSEMHSHTFRVSKEAFNMVATQLGFISTKGKPEAHLLSQWLWKVANAALHDDHKTSLTRVPNSGIQKDYSAYSATSTVSENKVLDSTPEGWRRKLKIEHKRQTKDSDIQRVPSEYILKHLNLPIHDDEVNFFNKGLTDIPCLNSPEIYVGEGYASEVYNPTTCCVVQEEETDYRFDTYIKKSKFKLAYLESVEGIIKGLVKECQNKSIGNHTMFDKDKLGQLCDRYLKK